ncbi:MAG: phosphate/phosphite/phosphonate ABC transporter substrate-binding protein [bacterium]
MNRKMIIMLMILINFYGYCYAEDSIKIGYMVCNSLKETEERFQPLTNYLNKKLGKKFEAVYLNTYDIEDAFREKKIDFVHANSVMYIILKKNYQAKLVVGEKRGPEGKNTIGTIIVRNESGIKNISDLKDKKFIFGPEFAPAGYLAVYDLLKRNGVDPEKDLAYYAIPSGSFKHEKVLYAVYYQAFDAGAAPLEDLREAIADKKFGPNDFRIIARSEMISYCTLAARKEIEDALIKQVKDVMIGIKKEDTVEVENEHLSVLKRAWLDGFIEVNDKDYDLLREMAKRVNLTPYEGN